MTTTEAALHYPSGPWFQPDGTYAGYCSCGFSYHAPAATEAKLDWTEHFLAEQEPSQPPASSPVRRVMASLVAAVSILRRAHEEHKEPRKVVASDKMFLQMLDDYDAAIDAMRSSLFPSSGEPASSTDRQKPRPSPHAVQGMKYQETLGFEGGSITIKTVGYGDSDGNGWFCFAEDECDAEENEDGKLYWIVNTPNPELIAIRDKLNEIFPVISGEPASVAGEAKYGWVFAGPDGHWHWSEQFQTHELVEDQRPATCLERGIFKHIGSTEALSKPTPVEAGLREAVLDMPFANTPPIDWGDYEWSRILAALSETRLDAS